MMIYKERTMCCGLGVERTLVRATQLFFVLDNIIILFILYFYLLLLIAAFNKED